MPTIGNPRSRFLAAGMGAAVGSFCAGRFAGLAGFFGGIGESFIAAGLVSGRTRVVRLII